jgi:hypothetical protein
VDAAGNRSQVTATASATTLAFTSTVYTLPSVGNQATQPRFGFSAVSGYLNNDGYPDLVVASPLVSLSSTSSHEGAVLVYLGTPTGVHTTPDFVVEGALAQEFIGNSIAKLNFFGHDDGIVDIAIGAPSTVLGGGGGAVFVCRGGSKFTVPSPAPTLPIIIHPDDILDPRHCELTITRSTPAGNLLGTALAGADFDGDTVDDLVIGAPGFDGYTGEAFIVYGVKPMPADTALSVPVPGSGSSYAGWQLTYPTATTTPQWGTFVFNVGKVQGAGDTTEDVVIGGGIADRAYVYYGRASQAGFGTIAPNGTGVATLVGENSGATIGSGIAGIGGQIVVGAPGTGNGRVYFVNGGATGNITLATAAVAIINGAAGEGLGSSIANPAAVRLPGDLNADGLPDLVVTNKTTPWKAYLFYGRGGGFGTTLTSADADWVFTPNGSVNNLSSLGFLLDVNGDGLPDLAAGDWRSAAASSLTLLE